MGLKVLCRGGVVQGGTVHTYYIEVGTMVIQCGKYAKIILLAVIRG